jgi:leucyl-tRNA synthetase
MREQLKNMGLAIDWSREFATCDVAYYARQQRLFLDFFRMGLVYRAEADVNWDPVDHTVLANEQVIEGRGWRSNALVERRKLSQWFFKITNFADDLLQALDRLERWPEKVRIMQKNWIGRSEGLRFSFALKNAPIKTVEVFSTRPDTLFGASFIALSPDHPLTEQLAAKDPKIAAFVAECHQGGTAEETIETAGKARLRHRHPGAASLRRQLGIACLHREFRADGLRHRRDLRVPRARSARPRLRAQIQPAGVACGHSRWRPCQHVRRP